MASYRLQHRNKSYFKGGKDVTKWTEEAENALKEYSDIISKYNADAVAWRKIGVFSLLLVLISIGVLVYTVNLPETELIVIGVNDIGETKYYGKTTGINYDGYDLKKYIIQNILQTYIEFTETIPNDSQLLYNNIVRAMYYLDKDTRRNVELQIRNEDPFKEVGRIRRVVEFETFIPLSDMTYQVDYKVITDSYSGVEHEEKKYREVFTLKKISARQYNSLKEKERVLNPMGLFIVDMARVEKEK